MLDLNADPGSVFLYRREPRELAERLGVDWSKMDGPTVPIVYSVSFVDPRGLLSGYSSADAQQRRHFLSPTRKLVDIIKFAGFLNTLISVPNNVAITGSNFETWRILSHTP